MDALKRVEAVIVVRGLSRFFNSLTSIAATVSPSAWIAYSVSESEYLRGSCSLATTDTVSISSLRHCLMPRHMTWRYKNVPLPI